eukprot:scaffold5993_cov46-Phaeocystis_antarctica.AAC.2
MPRICHPPWICHGRTSTLLSAPAPLSQGPSQQRPERQRALAARAPHRAGVPVSRTSASPPPSRGRGRGGRGRRAWRRIEEARASHLPPPAFVAVLFQQRPERQLALAARAAHRADEPVSRRTSAPASKPWQSRGQESTEGGSAQAKRACRTCRPLRSSPFPP